MDRPPVLDSDHTIPEDDESFLEALYDSVVESLITGSRPPLASEVARNRPHLLDRIQELIRLAYRVVHHQEGEIPIVPGYEIVREVGRGAMGVVYLAHQLAVDGRVVALKVLGGGQVLVSGARERFLAEARALARLSHPNIVRIHDAVHERGVLACAMEWIDGWSLAEVLDRMKCSLKLPPDAPDRRELPKELRSGDSTAFFCRMARTIAQALAAVHEAGLLHRDVKPSNILLRRDGTPLLSDFGLVRDEQSPTRTQSGVLIGTPAYAAPEQLRGEARLVDARSDVYGLGATLYECLSGEPPYGKSSVGEILRYSGLRGPRPLRKSNPRVSADIETVVATALDPDPARRYAGAKALAEDLDRLLGLQPVRARPISLAARAMRYARRQPAHATLWVLLVLGVPALAAVAAVVVPVMVRSVREERHLEVERQLARAFLHLEEGDSAKAAETFERMLAENPDHCEARAGIVLADVAAGRVEAALSRIEEGGKLEASLTLLPRLRAFVLRHSGRESEAQELITALPPPAGALDAWVESLVARRDVNAPDDGRWRRIHQLLIQTVLLSPRLRLVHVSDLCLAAGKSADEAGARSAVAALLQHWPDEPIARYRCGMVLRWLRDHESALRHARLAAQALPEFAPARNGFGNALDALGRTGEAIAEFEAAVSLDPRHAEAFHNLGMAHRKIGHPEIAITHLSRALELKPAHPRIHLNYGVALLDVDRNDDAAAAFEAAIRLLGREFQPVFNLGLARNRQRRFGEAEALFREALQQRPDDTLILACLGDVVAKLGRLDEALELLERGAALARERTGKHPDFESKIRSIRILDEAEALLRRPMLDSGDSLRAAETAAILASDGWHAHATRLCERILETGAGCTAARGMSPRILAATSALQWAAGGGHDAPPIAPEEAATLRRQALNWLRTGIDEARASPLNHGQLAADIERLRALRSIPPAVSLSTPAARLSLSPEDAAAWETLWRAVDTLLAAPP